MSEPGASAVITWQSGSEGPLDELLGRGEYFQLCISDRFPASEGQNKPHHSSHTTVFITTEGRPDALR